MNSNASGTTHTTITTLDYLDGSNSSLGGDTPSFNGIDNISNATPSSVHSGSSQTIAGDGLLRIYNYKLGAYHNTRPKTCEEICIEMCRMLQILPATRLLFGLRVHDAPEKNEWELPGAFPRSDVRYCFRMRFKVPAIDTQLLLLDPNAYEYLYRQMRYDLMHELIPEIRYPNKRNNVVGLGVVDMYIDELEGTNTPEQITSNYKYYLPRALIKEHKYFVKRKICNSYLQFRRKSLDLNDLKQNYVKTVHELAENYLMERFTAVVNEIPGDEHLLPMTGGVNNASTNALPIKPAALHVYVKLDLYETAKPGLKVARKTSEENLKWMLVAKLEAICLLYTEGKEIALLEICGVGTAYRIQFECEKELKSFISYLAGYARLTCKWALDLCPKYPTPSLEELKRLRIHGPIGGNFSYTKIREKRDECGRFIVRQCEREYDIYYIDMNTISANLQTESFKTETFKIRRDHARGKWILYLNNALLAFDSLSDLAKAVPADKEARFCLRPSEYDKPPLLLICLPKELKSEKAEFEMSETQLRMNRAQIFDPVKDLQWYRGSARRCDNGKMLKIRADWIHKRSYKDISVTLKVLANPNDGDFGGFMKLAHKWSKIYSPHFVKLYGLTLSTPHTMVMEYAPYGPLDHFLRQISKSVTLGMQLDLVHNLLRGIVYLRELKIVHGYIRCANLLVMQYDRNSNRIVAKIGDPGLPRAYTTADLPWIPSTYHNKILDAAKKDMSTDSFAFGTTLWEIFSRGQTIVNQTSQSLGMQYSKTGGILQSPENCPEEIYSIMLDCWSYDPSEFQHSIVLNKLLALKNENYSLPSKSSSYITITADPLPDQQNVYENSVTEEFNGFNGEECAVMPTTYERSTSDCNHGYFNSISTVRLLDCGKLIYKKKIGAGHYGFVFEGEMQYNGPEERREKVAIKELKNSKDINFNADFKREIDIMTELKHPNIVKIKHWVPNPLCLVMEYLEGGSLLVHLTTNKLNLTNAKLLRFALDIAKGMEYLGTKSVIHRDLAARNVLVDNDHVKISDFGLSQIADSKGYYLTQSKREIPYRWYSPDALRTEKFSFQSDVWSYGVTLFEMFSLGEIPNLPGLEHNKDAQTEFLERLEKGERLRKPAQCPDVVYENLMLRCWRAQPKTRPTFKELAAEITSIIENSNDKAISN